MVLTLIGTSRPSCVMIVTRASATGKWLASVSRRAQRLWQTSVRKISKQCLPSASSALKPVIRWAALLNEVMMQS